MAAVANSIPASQIVNVIPGVIGAGGSALSMSLLILTASAQVPSGTVQSFPTLASVQTYFGPNSPEAAAAAVYFLGVTNATLLPASLLFARYSASAFSAQLLGGPAPTLAALQALGSSLTLSVTIDGTAYSSGNASQWFNVATSLSLIGTAISFNLAYRGAQTAIFTGSVTGSTLTVSAVSSGTINVGDIVVGTGESSFIIAQLTGTAGGIGTYTVQAAANVSSETLTSYATAVTYNSTLNRFVLSSATTGPTSTITLATGTIAATLGFTAGSGGVASQGGNGATPAAFMSALTAINSNWASFQTLFDPDNGSGNTQKQAFATWVNTTEDAFLYIAWDTDTTPTTSATATSSLGYILQQNDSSGTACIWEPSNDNLHHATFVGSYVASINWNATNGRQTAAFKSQTGLVPSVTSAVVASNLLANGYNYYGAYASRSQLFNFLYNGTVSGPFAWIDSYVNQIWFNNLCQGALLTLLTSVGTIPYNPTGYGYIRHTLTTGASSSQVALPPASPVAAAINNGVISQNVPLSAGQVQAVNALAGQKVDGLLSTQGWALVIQPATAQVRAARQSPTIILIYMDGGSVQQINLSSVLVQ